MKNKLLIKIAEQAGFDVQLMQRFDIGEPQYHIGFGAHGDDVEPALMKFVELISIKELLLERIKYYILMNGGGEDSLFNQQYALDGMRFASFRDYCAEEFFGANLTTKQGRNISKGLKLANVMPKIAELEEAELLNILEMVIRRASRQM